MDYNAILKPYSDGDKVNIVVEIPKGSCHKLEYDRKRKIMVLDRVEPKIFAKPCNYGFIPGTLDEDGDELDVLFVTEDPVPNGVVSEAIVIGVLNFEDDGEMDHKIVCVPADNRNTGDSIKSLEDLGGQWQKQIEHHFAHYKDLKKPGSTDVQGFSGADEAHKIIKESIDRWEKELIE
jgi:inorganic pyrophosphatase